MAGVCRLCSKPAGPFGWFDPKAAPGQAHHLMFCCREHELFIYRWIREGKQPVNEIKDMEAKAIAKARGLVGRWLLNNGLMDKPFGQMSSKEALDVMTEMVRCFQAELHNLTIASRDPNDDSVPF
jgi:hypothetical protein